MKAKTDQYALEERDLQGAPLESVTCKQCSCFCSERQPVFWQKRPLAICTRNEKGRAVVARWKERTSHAPQDS